MDDIQDLIDQSSGTDITALLSAKETAKRRMLEDPTSSNISGYDRASAMLIRAVEKQKASEAPPELDTKVESIRFKKLSDVVKWLADEGYKIKKSKVYLDASTGFLASAEDGGFSEEAVIAYVHTQKLEKIADIKAARLDILTEKRLKKEVEKLTAQVDKLTWELNRDQGKFIPKDVAVMELALKISAFEAGFKHMVITRASDWISAIGGKQEKQQVLVDMIYSAIDMLLGEFAQVEELDLVVSG